MHNAGEDSETVDITNSTSVSPPQVDTSLSYIAGIHDTHVYMYVHRNGDLFLLSYTYMYSCCAGTTGFHSWSDCYDSTAHLVHEM